jgi:hypothetical protein
MMLGAVVEKTQPEGVFWVDLLTLLSALGLCFAALFIFVSGQAPWSSVSQLWVIEYTGLFGVWGVLLFVDVVLVFRGMRIGYFLSMVLWVLIFAADVWWGLGLLNGFNISISLYFIYYALYSVVCFAYFLRSNVRTYFGT